MRRRVLILHILAVAGYLQDAHVRADMESVAQVATQSLVLALDSR